MYMFALFQYFLEFFKLLLSMFNPFNALCWCFLCKICTTGDLATQETQHLESLILDRPDGH